MKPLGFYVSVVEEHPDHENLQNIESFYGSHFENVSIRELWAMLWWCSVCVPRSLVSFKGKPIAGLSGNTCFALVPFLHQVIDERMNNEN